MTNPAFLPNALLKEITGTEYQSKIPSFFNANHNLKELNRHQGRIFTLANKAGWLKRIDPISSVTDIISNLPWWLACNQARYPYWFGQSDPRNELLLKAMQSEPSQKNSNTLNIARGTTDPGYWVHNPWKITFWRWNEIHVWLQEPGLESKAWIIFAAKTKKIQCQHF